MVLRADYFKIIDDIKHGRIYSSTETVLSGLRLIYEIVRNSKSLEDLSADLTSIVPLLLKARPTSAMMWNCVKDLVSEIVEAGKDGKLENIKEKAFEKEKELEKKIVTLGEITAKMASHRINDGDIILTNSYSTIVLKAFSIALREGKDFKVYVTESRPGSEGFDLAARLAEMGLDVTIFVDSAVRYMIKEVDNVFLSSEAIAANGALVNKVGTSLIALAANEARVRTFALAPTIKFSPETLLGELVVLAEGEPTSILPEKLRSKSMGKVKIRVPLFDVTPPEYIDGIFTEKGLVAPQAVIVILREIYGWPFKFITLEEVIEVLKTWQK